MSDYAHSRWLVLIGGGLALATLSAAATHGWVSRKSKPIGLLWGTVMIHERLGLDQHPDNYDFEIHKEALEANPDLARFMDVLSKRITPFIRDGSLVDQVSTMCFTQDRRGWPFASWRPAYQFQISRVDGVSVVDAARDGKHPFSLLAFSGNVCVHAVPLTLGLVCLGRIIRRWREKRLMRRRGFPVVMEEDQ